MFTRNQPQQDRQKARVALITAHRASQSHCSTAWLHSLTGNMAQAIQFIKENSRSIKVGFQSTINPSIS